MNNFFKLSKVGKRAAITTLTILGAGSMTTASAMLLTPKMASISASEVMSTKTPTLKLPGRQSIEDEDRAIYFSSLSVLSPESSKIPWNKNWDKRDPESMVRPLKDDPNAEEVLKHKEKVELAKPKSKRTLILVRHGQYNISATTDSDRYLTETGKLQADITGQRLVSIVEYLKTRTKKDENGNMTPLLVNFVKSTMTRATETADIILKHFPDVNSHQSCDLIREGAPCPPEPPHPEWDPTPSQFFVEGARIEAAFRRYIHRADPEQEHDSVDILVCHGNVIRYFICRALQFPPEAWLRFAVHNGSITMLTVNKDGDAIVTALGEAGHLPIDKLTFN